jgi:hypothetical protein
VPGAIVATVAIFLPSFVFVALSSPLIPRLRRSTWAAGFLDGANAASVALMALVTWQLGRAAIVDWVTAALALAAAVLLLATRLNSRGSWPGAPWPGAWEPSSGDLRTQSGWPVVQLTGRREFSMLVPERAPSVIGGIPALLKEDHCGQGDHPDPAERSVPGAGTHQPRGRRRQGVHGDRRPGRALPLRRLDQQAVLRRHALEDRLQGAEKAVREAEGR